MAVPALNAEEYQFGDNGTLLNADATMPFVDLTEVDGLDSAPTRQQTHDREDTDGGYVDSQYETIRAVTLSGTVYAPTTQLDSYLDQLSADFAPSKLDVPLYFGTDFGATRCVFGKSQGFNYAKTSARSTGNVDFQVQIMCGDPRKYTAIPITATSTGGAVTVTLDGNRESPATITIDGPANGPTITNTDTGTEFDFTGLTLASGDQLVINLSNRTVILTAADGTQSGKRGAMKLTGLWYMLKPGDNHLTFGGSGSFTVTTRSAWR